MNPLYSVVLLSTLFFTLQAPAQVTGRWKSVDDNTGEVKSIVEIFENGGKIFGRVVQIFPKPGENPDPVCDQCPPDDSRHLKKILGMEIIRFMEADGTEYTGGDILDPEVGRVYRCKLWLEGKNLKVRGYLGPFYRTQTWLRIP
ncbi:MAG TPA: DUF2147 domain-containing protein [Cytophagales bacterium]|nr:DUF2147 domain-containing protein [Cytophagales bacterium]